MLRELKIFQQIKTIPIYDLHGPFPGWKFKPLTEFPYIMYSNEDLERFYFQYQTEALPSGESVQSFCKRNNEPYKAMLEQFEKDDEEWRRKGC